MITLAFYAAALALAYLSRLIGKRWYPGYFFGGLIFGLYNEICFEMCWTYSPAFGVTIWRDVPLIVVIGWGVLTMLALVLSDRLRTHFNITGFWLQRGLDVVMFCLVGIPNELIVSGLGYWSYNFPIMGSLPMVVFGYVGVGIIVSSIGRTIQQRG
jgi:hypothetical protein